MTIVYLIAACLLAPTVLGAICCLYPPKRGKRGPIMGWAFEREVELMAAFIVLLPGLLVAYLCLKSLFE